LNKRIAPITKGAWTASAAAGLNPPPFFVALDRTFMPSAVDLYVTLGRLRLTNPILVASGTFGYAREMAGLVDLKRLGGILPKTITKSPRPGNWGVPVVREKREPSQ